MTPIEMIMIMPLEGLTGKRTTFEEVPRRKSKGDNRMETRRHKGRRTATDLMPFSSVCMSNLFSPKRVCVFCV